MAGSALVDQDPVRERVVGGVKVGARGGCLEGAESEEAEAGAAEAELEGSRILAEALGGSVGGWR